MGKWGCLSLFIFTILCCYQSVAGIEAKIPVYRKLPTDPVECFPSGPLTAAGVHPTLVPTTPGVLCHREYLLSLSDLYRTNLIDPTNQKVWDQGTSWIEYTVSKYREDPSDDGRSLRPKQWAGLGFDRKIRTTDSSRNLVSILNAVDDGFGVHGKELISAKLVEKSNEIFTGEPEDFGEQAYQHTEKALRAKFYPYGYGSNTPLSVTAISDNPPTSKLDTDWSTVNDVYVYTYSTPCYRQCSRDVFSGDRGLAKRIRRLKRTPNPNVKFYVGFHSQYHGNDDFQLWRAYHYYADLEGVTARTDAGATIPQLPEERWSVIPLDHTFQTLLTEVILAQNPWFCETCQLSEDVYLPTAKYVLPVWITRGTPQIKSIYYIIETIIHKIAADICGRNEAYCLNPERKGDPRNDFRDVLLWKAAIEALVASAPGGTPTVKEYAINRVTKVFGEALDWEFKEVAEESEEDYFEDKLFKGLKKSGKRPFPPIGPWVKYKEYYILTNPEAVWKITECGGRAGRFCEFSNAFLQSMDVVQRRRVKLDFSWPLDSAAIGTNADPGVCVIYERSSKFAIHVEYSTQLSSIHAILDQKIQELRPQFTSKNHRLRVSCITLTEGEGDNKVVASEPYLREIASTLKLLYCLNNPSVAEWRNCPSNLDTDVSLETYFATHIHNRLTIGEDKKPSLPSRLADVPVDPQWTNTFKDHPCLIPFTPSKK